MPLSSESFFFHAGLFLFPSTPQELSSNTMNRCGVTVVRGSTDQETLTTECVSDAWLEPPPCPARTRRAAGRTGPILPPPE